MNLIKKCCTVETTKTTKMVLHAKTFSLKEVNNTEKNSWREKKFEERITLLCNEEHQLIGIERQSNPLKQCQQFTKSYISAA